ncbi:MAG: RagB/SusD family nutrient uptake outer membrane protein, partial [Gemmatimonadota bacterium]|nr:RagB/SusD family nutrient uptake outer membrane protein [Gemmatimonadota bacterium]
SGYSHVLLGEMFCEGVLLDENLVPGGLATRQQLFERAEQRFTRAIEAARASNNTDILNMALVGRARTRLNLGKKAEAATDARLVPNNYVRNATASSVASRRENRVFAQNNQGQAVSIAPEYRNLTTGGVADPRVRATDTGRTNADGTRVFVQNKYASLTTSLPIATWREAQLIIAEAAVQTNPAEAVSIINALRTRAGVALPAFSSSNPAEIMNQVIEERRRELFLEGHHLGDMIRYNLPFRPATGTVFPAPTHGNPKGGTYGATRCLPLPNVERFNNPLIPSA